MTTPEIAEIDTSPGVLNVAQAALRLEGRPGLPIQKLDGSGALNGQALGDLLSLAYDAAAGLADWNELASSLCNLLDCSLLCIFLQGPSSDSTEILGFAGKGVVNHFGPPTQIARDKAWSLCQRERPASGAIVGETSAPSRSGRWDARVSGSLCYVIGERLTPSEEYLCIGCSETQGEVTPALTTRNKFGIVLPHLARAARIGRRLRMAATQTFANDAILDRMPFAVFQLDSKGLVISFNARAQRIAKLCKGLTVTQAGICGVAIAGNMQLQKAIAEVLAGAGSRRICVSRGLDERPYTVLVSRITPDCSGVSQQTACAVFVTDPEEQFSPSAEVIAELFSLTPAEARVVCGLVMGVSLPHTAMRLGVSINTARTLLSRARSRTGANSQIALVRAVLTGLGLVQQDE